MSPGRIPPDEGGFSRDGELKHVDLENLQRLAERQAASFREADPFPHVIFDGLLRPDAAVALEQEFPRPDHLIWKHHLHLNSHKFACNRLETMPQLFREVLEELNSRPVVEALERLTGIPDLRPDADLEGGGLHQIVRGGFLKVHADFNYHPRTRFHRRLNLLVYLNRDWLESWNGNLELWDPGMSRCAKSIRPQLNRCVIFATTDLAYHGHPRPLCCPETATRKSLALYYYTADRPPTERTDPHSTLYRRTPTDSRIRHLRSVMRGALVPGTLSHAIREFIERTLE